MRDKKEIVRVEVTNYDPSEVNANGVIYHFNINDTEKILDFLKVNIDAGMYVLIHPWWQSDERRSAN